MYDRIWESSVEVGFFSPPTTHLVATVEESIDNDHADKYNGTPLVASGLVPSLGKWVQNITHVWQALAEPIIGPTGSEHVRGHGSHSEYCPENTGPVDAWDLSLIRQM